jgi:uncharacterized protein
LISIKAGRLSSGFYVQKRMEHWAEGSRAMRFMLNYIFAAVLLLNVAAPGTAGPVNDAVAAYNKGDYATALQLIRPLADQGNPVAQNNLGVLYGEGHGVPQNWAEAVKWYRRAADQGYAIAQLNLGERYRLGEGVPRDYAEAVKWYRRAADQCYPNAQFRLGLMYTAGQGVPEDHAQAVTWYRRAADQGFADAQFHLGLMYGEGTDVPQDPVRAYMWTALAAAQGDEDAIAMRDVMPAWTDPAQIAEAEKLVREWKPLVCVLLPLAQRRAAAMELEVKFRALSDDQKMNLEKEMASIQNRVARSEVDTFLHAIQFLSPTVGFALDWHGLLHRTSDGGLTWAESRLPLGGRAVGWLSNTTES